MKIPPITSILLLTLTPSVGWSDPAVRGWTTAQLEANVRAELLRDGQDLARLGLDLGTTELSGGSMLIALSRGANVLHQRVYEPVPEQLDVAIIEVKQIVQGFLAQGAPAAHATPSALGPPAAAPPPAASSGPSASDYLEGNRKIPLLAGVLGFFPGLGLGHLYAGGYLPVGLIFTLIDLGIIGAALGIAGSRPSLEAQIASNALPSSNAGPLTALSVAFLVGHIVQAVMATFSASSYNDTQSSRLTVTPVIGGQDGGPTAFGMGLGIRF